jgi:GntR family transcriptional regulator/MocR family aminotransferase
LPHRLRHQSGDRPQASLTGCRAYGRYLANFALPPERDREGLATDFRRGDIVGADFPRFARRKAITAAVLRRLPCLQYRYPAGSPCLRTVLQGYLWRARGLRCELDQIIAVNGSQQGLDLCSRLLLDPEDRVVMENPGYNLARRGFLAAGAEVIPIAMDEEGMRTDELSPARLAYTTPSHQFPLGSPLSARRRRDLCAWAERTLCPRHRGQLQQRIPLRHLPVPYLACLGWCRAGYLPWVGLQDSRAQRPITLNGVRAELDDPQHWW